MPNRRNRRWNRWSKLWKQLLDAPPPLCYVSHMKSSFERGSEGQGVVEYGLIIGLIAIIVIAVFVALGPQIKEIWSPDSVQTQPAPTSDTRP